MNNIVGEYVLLFLTTFSIFLFLFIIFYGRKTSSIFLRLYVIQLTNKYLFAALLLVLSCIFLQYVTLLTIAHSFYKSFIIIHLIYLLSGYQVIYFNLNNNKKRKFTYTMIFIQLTLILFLYI